MASKADAAAAQAAQQAKDQADVDKSKAPLNPDGSNLNDISVGAQIGANNKQYQDTTQVYHDPGSADYGQNVNGNGVKFYGDEAKGMMAGNDVEQKQSADNAAAALKAAQTAGGRVGSKENGTLSARADVARNQELDAANINRIAAQGGAPSAAAGQAKLGMNATMAANAGAAGSARGLAGLSGTSLAGAATTGATAGNIAATAGSARSGEIGQAIQDYGSQAGQIRGQDLTRLGTGDQNAMANAGMNDAYAVGEANLAAGNLGLGVQQQAVDNGWFGQSMAPADIQFQLDQEAQGWQAGANTDAAVNAVAKSEAQRQQTAATVGGITQAGLTAVGSMAGPVGAAAGGMAGTAINSATQKYY